MLFKQCYSSTIIIKLITPRPFKTCVNLVAIFIYCNYHVVNKRKNFKNVLKCLLVKIINTFKIKLLKLSISNKDVYLYLKVYIYYKMSCGTFAEL